MTRLRRGHWPIWVCTVVLLVVGVAIGVKAVLSRGEAQVRIAQTADPATATWRVRTDTATGLHYALPNDLADATVSRYVIDQDIPVRSSTRLQVQFASSLGYWITIAYDEAGNRVIRDESIVTPLKVAVGYEAGYYVDQDVEHPAHYVLFLAGKTIYQVTLPRDFLKQYTSNTAVTLRLTQFASTLQR
jgi:hypothetical protein